MEISKIEKIKIALRHNREINEMLDKAGRVLDELLRAIKNQDQIRVQAEEIEIPELREEMLRIVSPQEQIKSLRLVKKTFENIWELLEMNRRDLKILTNNYGEETIH